MTKPPAAPPQALHQELSDILGSLTGEHLLAIEPIVRALGAASERERLDKAPRNANGEPIVSSDPDGTTYTEKEYFAMLDARVERIRNGEGVLSFEEFSNQIDQFWESRR